MYVYFHSNVCYDQPVISINNFMLLFTNMILIPCIMYKWKNHFSEMKGDVGMSLHEKEGEQEDSYTETRSH